jgi:hypothetical protein
MAWASGRALFERALIQAAAGVDDSASDDSSLSLLSEKHEAGPGSSLLVPGDASGETQWLTPPEVADRSRGGMRAVGIPDAGASLYNGLARGINVSTEYALTGPARGTGASHSDVLSASPVGRLHLSGAAPLDIVRKVGRPASDVPAETLVSVGGEALPPACGADLLASFSPFDLAKVETAVDRLLESLDDLETGLSRLGRTESLVPGLAAIGLAIGATQLFHRRLIGRRNEDGPQTVGYDDREEDASFPGLPGLPRHWSREES